MTLRRYDTGNRVFADPGYSAIHAAVNDHPCVPVPVRLPRLIP